MPERRGSPRIQLSVACTLRRATGSPISGRTLDLGEGGMSITTTRPLAPDEVLDFALPIADGEIVDGRARVLRERGYQIYSLRFESLHEPARDRLPLHSRSSGA